MRNPHDAAPGALQASGMGPMALAAAAALQADGSSSVLQAGLSLVGALDAASPPPPATNMTLDEADSNRTETEILRDMVLPAVVSTGFLALLWFVSWLIVTQRSRTNESSCWHSASALCLEAPTLEPDDPAASGEVEAKLAAPSAPAAPREADAEIWIDVRDMAFCGVSVISVLITYGYYQEDVMTTLYYNDEFPEGELFTHSTAITLFNRICIVILAFVLIGAMRLAGRCGWWDEAGVYKRAAVGDYAIGGYANTMGSICQYASIHFISFELLLLSKACKMPPVMIVNSVCFGRRYASRQPRPPAPASCCWPTDRRTVLRRRSAACPEGLSLTLPWPSPASAGTNSSSGRPHSSSCLAPLSSS